MPAAAQAVASSSPCTLELHAEYKRDPAQHLINPVEWPEAGFRLWQCRYCYSHLAIKYSLEGDSHARHQR